MAATVAMAMPMSAMAANITVESSIPGATYNVYKIFNYTRSGDAFSYTIDTDSEWKTFVTGYTYNGINVFTLEDVPGNDNVKLVKVNEVFTNAATKDAAAKDFAKKAAEEVKNHSSNYSYTATKTAAEGEKTEFTGLDEGYYFLNTTAGTLCSLTNIDANEKVKEKNILPGIHKEIVGGDEDGKVITAYTGEVINYKITVTDKDGTNQKITVHDEMDAGLELQEITVIGKDGKALAEGANTYTIKKEKADLTDNCTFEIEISAAYVAEMNTDDTVVITYGAKIKSDVKMGSALKNKASITYLNKTTPDPKDPEVFTYKFDLTKVKESEDGEVLDGAEFELQDKNGKALSVVAEYGDKDNPTKITAYHVAAEGEANAATKIEAGKVEIKGLKNGTYTLVEKKAPAGYNLATENATVTIENANGGERKIVNHAGTLLPSTGGIGTTIFYAAGIVVMAGAVFFVVRSRKHD